MMHTLGISGSDAVGCNDASRENLQILLSNRHLVGHEKNREFWITRQQGFYFLKNLLLSIGQIGHLGHLITAANMHGHYPFASKVPDGKRFHRSEDLGSRR